MPKTQITLLAILIVSLAANAWQWTRQSVATQPNPNSNDAQPLAPGNALQRTPAKADASAEPATRKEASAHMNLASIMAMQDPMERMQALVEHIKSLPVDQIGEMLDELDDSKDPKTRFLTHLLLTRWGQEDPDAAFASLGNISAKRNGSQARAILEGLTAIDPSRAVAWLTSPENDARHQPWMGLGLARSLASEWSRQNPEAAIAWAASLEPGDLQTGAYLGIVENLMKSDPERAAAIAMDVETGARSEFLGSIAEDWARQAPEDAIEWVGTLEGHERQTAMSEAMAGWAQEAPKSAAAYLDGLPADERNEHIGALARSWAEQEPGAAANWLGSQPEGDSKVEAMGHVMWNWTSQDPEAASAWLAEQPPGDSFDRGAAGLAKAATSAFEDPEAGVAWSSSIQNEELRTEMTRHTLQRWMRQDPEAAQAWAEANPVEGTTPSREGGK